MALCHPPLKSINCGSSYVNGFGSLSSRGGRGETLSGLSAVIGKPAAVLSNPANPSATSGYLCQQK